MGACVNRNQNFDAKWSEADVAALLALWADGKSCKEVAIALYKTTGLSVTRDGVASKVKRLRDMGVAIAPRPSPIIRKQ